MGAEWHVAGAGDFNLDGNADILWQSNAGNLAVWSMNGTALGTFGIASGQMGSEWNVAAVGDFNGDGRSDALWVTASGQVSIWSMNGSDMAGFNNVGAMGSEWRVAGVGNFNGDSTSDIVWVNGNNDVQIWYMAGGGISQIVTPDGHEGSEWRLDGVADLTGDHNADLLWANNSGSTHIWQVNGTQVTVLPGTGPTAASPSAGLAAEPGFTAVPVTDGDLILTAQPGPEAFDFSSWSFGHDSIQNFAPGEDVIRLNQSLSGDFANLQAHISSVGDATLINIDPSRSLTLDHVSVASLTAANFRFV
jgi:hypothetical protein